MSSIGSIRSARWAASQISSCAASDNACVGLPRKSEEWIMSSLSVGSEGISSKTWATISLEAAISQGEVVRVETRHSREVLSS